MKLAAVLIALTAGMTCAAMAAPQIGQPAPDFTGIDSNGKTHSLSDYKGKKVILEWTNHRCPYVRKHYSTGNMQKLQKDTTAEGIVWLTVISSAPGKQGYVTGDEANELTASRGAAPTAVILDSTGVIGHAYEAKTSPHMYIIGKDSTLLYMGAIDDKPDARKSSIKTATNYVRVALAEIADGKPVGKPVTRAYGCSIKYGG